MARGDTPKGEKITGVKQQNETDDSLVDIIRKNPQKDGEDPGVYLQRISGLMKEKLDLGDEMPMRKKA